MSDLPCANNYSELLVYQKTLDLAGSIFKNTRNFPEKMLGSMIRQTEKFSGSGGSYLSEDPLPYLSDCEL
jgi:hypothetical protein